MTRALAVFPPTERLPTARSRMRSRTHNKSLLAGRKQAVGWSVIRAEQEAVRISQELTRARRRLWSVNAQGNGRGNTINERIRQATHALNKPVERDRAHLEGVRG